MKEEILIILIVVAVFLAVITVAVFIPLLVGEPIEWTRGKIGGIIIGTVVGSGVGIWLMKRGY